MPQRKLSRFSFQVLLHPLPFQPSPSRRLAEEREHSAVPDNEEVDGLNREFEMGDNVQHRIPRVFSHRCLCHEAYIITQQTQCVLLNRVY